MGTGEWGQGDVSPVRNGMGTGGRFSCPERMPGYVQNSLFRFPTDMVDNLYCVPKLFLAVFNLSAQAALFIFFPTAAGARIISANLRFPVS